MTPSVVWRITSAQPLVVATVFDLGSFVLGGLAVVQRKDRGFVRVQGGCDAEGTAVAFGSAGQRWAVTAVTVLHFIQWGWVARCSDVAWCSWLRPRTFLVSLISRYDYPWLSQVGEIDGNSRNQQCGSPANFCWLTCFLDPPLIVIRYQATGRPEVWHKLSRLSQILGYT